MESMNSVLISDSERCSRLTTVNFAIVSRIKGAAVVLLAVALFLPARAFADVAVRGLPSWLTPTVQRSLEAVWGRIDQEQSPETRERLLRLVSKRLFPGLSLSEISITGESGVMFFEMPEPYCDWQVELDIPEKNILLRNLFIGDVSGLGQSVRSMLSGVAARVLEWSGRDFEKNLEGLVAERSPGWRPVVKWEIREAPDKNICRIAFYPQEPLLLAFSPKMESRTLPLILQTEIQEQTLEATAPFIGLPLPWVEKHKAKIERHLSSVLEEKWSAREVQGQVKLEIKPEKISPLRVQVESPRYTIQGWLAAPVGSDERYSELALHIGRKSMPFPGWELEWYGEWLVAADDLGLESRWGARWSPVENIWTGFEVAWPGSESWWRVWFEEPVPDIYAWLRYREDGETNWALGWRFREHLSWELYYDSRDEDDLCLRLVGNL